MNLWLLYFAMFQSVVTDADAGPFVQALRTVQTFGTVEAAAPGNDRTLKATLAQSLAKDKTISLDEANGIMTQDVFAKLAGDDKLLTRAEMDQALAAAIPKSRERLLPRLREHADYLSTTFDMLSESQLQSSHKLAAWLIANYKANSNGTDGLHVIIICTGNSRRSMLGSSMGNLAAAYYGLENVHFHSGGTTPSAFNQRTIRTLQEIGFEITSTGQRAERGDPKVDNPKYRVSWGRELEAIEYSKKYSDSTNPASGFAAVMVCSEADSECPNVPGAALRLPMPFLDPKSYDDSKYEAVKYAERRDDIGRSLMAAMAIVSRGL